MAKLVATIVALQPPGAVAGTRAAWAGAIAAQGLAAARVLPGVSVEAADVAVRAPIRHPRMAGGDGRQAVIASVGPGEPSVPDTAPKHPR